MTDREAALGPRGLILQKMRDWSVYGLEEGARGKGNDGVSSQRQQDWRGEIGLGWRRPLPQADRKAGVGGGARGHCGAGVRDGA